jgi:hypothetical protein
MLISSYHINLWFWLLYLHMSVGRPFISVFISFHPTSQSVRSYIGTGITLSMHLYILRHLVQHCYMCQCCNIFKLYIFTYSNCTIARTWTYAIYSVTCESIFNIYLWLLIVPNLLLHLMSKLFNMLSHQVNSVMFVSSDEDLLCC